MATFKSPYIQGSPLVGCPIIVQPQANTITLNTDDVLAFHRLVVEVKARLSTDSSYTTISFSSSVDNGEVVQVDISSALRALADNYEYTSQPGQYPHIIFQVSAREEYMKNGDTYNIAAVYLPSESTYYSALFGSFSDMERMLESGNKSVKKFTNKPTTSPQVVCIGETFVYTPPYDYELYFDAITAGPKSEEVTITTAGAQTYGGVNVYAIEADSSQDRYQFRFINKLGVLESLSVYSLRESEVNITQNQYTLALQETFNAFSRGITRKQKDYETWKMNSGPMTQDWLSWFIHEFLMAEHIWILLNGIWVRCHIDTDESVTSVNRNDNSMLSVDFSVRMDFNGRTLM